MKYDETFKSKLPYVPIIATQNSYTETNSEQVQVVT